MQLLCCSPNAGGGYQPTAAGRVQDYVFYVFFDFKKRVFLRFSELLHTFSRTVATGEYRRRREPAIDRFLPLAPELIAGSVML